MPLLWQNLRFALRMLLRQPGFAAVVVLTLALGIGANTAIFSVVHGVVLKPLALPDSQRLMQVGWSYRQWFGSIDDAQFRHFGEHQRSFGHFVASTGASFTLVGDDGGLRVVGLHVSAGYFETVGVMPALGRPFVAEDDREGAPSTVILSDRLWRGRFGADPGLVGRDIRLDDRPYRVVGVMPAGFDDLSAAALWTPLAPVAASIGQGTNYQAIGRLREGVSAAQADAEFASLARAWMELQGGDAPEGLGFAVMPLRDALAREVRTPLFLLLGAVAFVLLIACANVANLMLARATARAREMAVRAAIGASRQRLSLQVLTESVLLAMIGALLGLVLAAWGIDALLALQGEALPRAGEVGLDMRAFGFSLLLALAVGLLAGLPPAWQASRRDINAPLKGIEGQALPRRLPLPGLRSVLAGGQVALALVLLVGAGLLIQTFAHLARVDPGFTPERALAAQFWTSGTRHQDSEAIAALHQALEERVSALPGVSAAGVVVAGLPLQRGGNFGGVFEGQPESETFGFDYRSVTPGYFEALGLSLRQGRVIEARDVAGAPAVAVVNEAFARIHAGESDLIGRRLLLANSSYEIVGVVADVRSYLNDSAPPTVLLPVAQSPAQVMGLFEGWFPSHLLVRSELPPASLVAAVREAMREVDRELPLGSIRPMDEVFAAALAGQRFHMSLMSVFAGLALVLAAIGVYGVLAYSVARRTREIGIHVALGAGSRAVLGKVLAQGMRPVVGGLLAGLFGAWLLSRLMAGMLFGVEAFDPATFALVAAGLGAVALVACLLPALRATRADPLMALRQD
jgi:putative ABC transport system permease protein